MSNIEPEKIESSAYNEYEEDAAAHSSVNRGVQVKRKADVVRPGPLYKLLDAIVTVAGLALVGAIVLYVIMIFG